MSQRERRLVALLILVALIAFAYLCVIAPIAAGFAARADRRAAFALRYEHNMRTIASIPRLRRQAERQRAAIASFVLAAATAEAARESLKQRLQGTIERTGGEFREAGDAEGRPGWARARATARLTLPQTLAVLKMLQDTPPYLVTDGLAIDAGEAMVTGRPSIMDVQIETSIPFRRAAAR